MSNDLRGPTGTPDLGYALREMLVLSRRIDTLERLNIGASKQRVILGAATIVQGVAIIVLAVTR